VSLAVGSSAPRENVDLILGAMGVTELISVIVSGDDVTRGKPDPQVFGTACRRLGMEPARCVVVEDAPAGIQAARAAGARTVAVLMHHAAEDFTGADLIVDRLSNLSVERLAELVEDKPV
jgi:beta-phosphoglucomutase-like phosphatase (HAD superfamily)